ncbi:hypothetical protein [Methanobrevibacter sp.]|uniref:hypothetical protein n=1 Tax=Methanobrevibacter sp. TaxID=66852 RepID=UPI00388FAFAF
MSELSELIEIAKNIERQNDEIIRLLKIIACESEGEKPKNDSVLNLTPDFGELILSNKDADEKEEFELDDSLRIGTLLDNDIDVGEVYFIDGSDIFKLTINNNEVMVDNLTSDAEPNTFALQEMIANESIKNNSSLEDGTVILSNEQCENLPEKMKICVEQGARKVYMPLFASAQLVGAPQNLINYVKMDFYKNNDHLIDKLF